MSLQQCCMISDLTVSHEGKLLLHELQETPSITSLGWVQRSMLSGSSIAPQKHRELQHYEFRAANSNKARISHGPCHGKKAHYLYHPKEFEPKTFFEEILQQTCFVCLWRSSRSESLCQVWQKEHKKLFGNSTKHGLKFALAWPHCHPGSNSADLNQSGRGKKRGKKVKSKMSQICC